MQAICCSTIGQRHISTGRRCEDRSKTFSANGVTAIAVADGAGSDTYDFAADGAQCVVDTITRFLCNNFEKFYTTESEEELATVVIGICREALQKKAEELDVDSIQRMASTLLAVAVKDNRFIACHLGDGVIGRLTPDGAEVITAPDNGEFAGTTFFVTTQGAVSHLRIKRGFTGNTISYFMMSDGAADFLLNADGTFATAAEKMALLAEKSDGQQQLVNIMQETIVQLDAMSDDCSYAALSVRRSTSSIRQRIQQASAKPKDEEQAPIQQNDPTVSMPPPMMQTAPVGGYPPSQPVQKKKRGKAWIIILSIVGLCAVIGITALILHHKNTPSDVETTEEVVTDAQTDVSTSIPATTMTPTEDNNSEDEPDEQQNEPEKDPPQVINDYAKTSFETTTFHVEQINENTSSEELA